MVLKKINTICSWIIIGFLLGHLGTMCYSMLTGWYDYSICKGLANGTAVVAAIHVMISLIRSFSMTALIFRNIKHKTDGSCCSVPAGL